MQRQRQQALWYRRDLAEALGHANPLDYPTRPTCLRAYCQLARRAGRRIVLNVLAKVRYLKSPI
jgi:hypothetical protein